MFYSRIGFEGPLWQVFGGVEGVKPCVYVGFNELEFDKPYRVVLKVSRVEPPETRRRGSLVAVYALLYKTQRYGKATLKFGSISASIGGAGLLWAQAPLYAGVVGVFRLGRDLELEYLEGRCVRLVKGLSRYRELFNLTYRIPAAKHVVGMWRSVDELGSGVEELIDEVEGISRACFDHLAGLEYLDPIYGSDMWLRPPIQRVEAGPNHLNLQKLTQYMGREGAHVNECGGVRGLLKVTPVGLCTFTILDSAGFGGVGRVYVDVCRKFVYETEISLEEL